MDLSLTSGRSFPLTMAVTDSKQPVVENDQQLPQWPLGDKQKQNIV